MSVQFGRWSFDGLSPGPRYLETASEILSAFGPDGRSVYSSPGVDILYHAFCTTRESRSEQQPHVARTGEVIICDGRLDNRGELIHQLGGVLSQESSDASLIASAYEQWGDNSFAKLVGDWALSIWNPNEPSLLLAKDPIGTRPLYYACETNHVTWSTILDPLVLLADRTFSLNEEYMAGWLSFFPAAHLTPYIGIHSVPPSCFVRIRAGKQIVRKYWDFDPAKRIRYRSDGEYEDHFRALFLQSVRRRLRSDAPVLAELSGGIDSSAIVCMGDVLMKEGVADTPRLDTVSYYDDSEPNWNERPYFTAVERYRGREGFHIDFSSQDSRTPESPAVRFSATPSSNHSSEAAKKFAACVAARGNRVVLSGMGGDEVTGGIPSPVPELAGLFARARFAELIRKLKAWAIYKRKPWVHLAGATLREFLPPALVDGLGYKRPPDWLCHDYVRAHRDALRGYRRRLKLFGPLPSFQENLQTLDALRRQLACASLPATLCEMRYPFLDRELLEFLYAAPADQVLRPGQRRSLMRRALSGVVPNAVLDRKRKAFVIRHPIGEITTKANELFGSVHSISLSHLGIVDFNSLATALKAVRQGDARSVIPLNRTFLVEEWIRGLGGRCVLSNALEESIGIQQSPVPPGMAGPKRFLSAEKYPMERR